MKGGYNKIILKHTLDNSIFYRRNLIILQIHFQAFRFFPSALVHGPIHCSKANTCIIPPRTRNTTSEALLLNHSFLLPSSPEDNHYADFQTQRVALSISELPINVIKGDVLFYVWLLSFSKMFLRFIHVAHISAIHAFLSQYIVRWMNRPLYPYYYWWAFE